MTEAATKFAAELDDIARSLHAAPPSLADTPWRVGGWTRKQIVGHLCDSAANNRQRFVRASTDGTYGGPGYAQDAWVEAHGYAEKSWETLLGWWQAEHDILKAVVARIPEARMTTLCTVGDDAPVTLQFLIEDYIAHQRWHLKQVQALAPPR